MPKTILQGRFAHRLRSLCTLLATTADVLARRAIGRPRVAEWPMAFEIGTLFWRHQFNHAFSLNNVVQARAYFDSLYTVVEPHPRVDIRPTQAGEPRGDWFIPHGHSSPLTLLYFHGGGYTFHAAVTRHFIAMLAQMLEVPIFSVDYRLTPEHPHPAQIEDALVAYRFLLDKGIDPAHLVVCGDSAGGHLALMTLPALREAGLAQPALTMALSPWTDIGRRGASQFDNDRYDMVQGYQTLQFAEWLKGGRDCSDAQLSPSGQDYRGLAPIYLQAGGKEILVDMIRDFARQAEHQGAQVRLDVWAHMTHEFHGYGNTLPQSAQAISRLRSAMDWATGGFGATAFGPIEQTEVDALRPHEHGRDVAGHNPVPMPQGSTCPNH
jgi:monoterpene epsilon-lactone hydrolase